jgi:hypothetical protein
MTLPTSATIQALTRCKVLPGFFPGGFCDQFIRRIPFHDVTGYGQLVSINRASLGAAAPYAANDAMNLNASSSATTTFNFRRIGDTVEVDSADITSSEETQQQLDLQVAMKKVAVVRLLSLQLIQGGGVSPDLLGLAGSVDATQTINPLAGVNTAPTLDDYHKLLTMVCASDGMVGTGPDALVMHPRTRRQLMSVLEAAAGGCAQFAADETIDHPVLLFEGIPVYVDESVSTTETDAGLETTSDRTSVFAVKLNGPTGIRVLHQGGDSSEFGLITEEVPAQLSISKRATTVRGFYALMIPEIKSVARLKAINIGGFVG